MGDRVRAIANETPDALPNPNKLTFSGAVKAEYDGSKAVSVNIPQGVEPESIKVAVNEYLDENPVMGREWVNCGTISITAEEAEANPISVIKWDVPDNVTSISLFGTMRLSEKKDFNASPNYRVAYNRILNITLYQGALDKLLYVKAYSNLNTGDGRWDGFGDYGQWEGSPTNHFGCGNERPGPVTTNEIYFGEYWNNEGIITECNLTLWCK